jgi:hypothetical protein
MFVGYGPQEHEVFKTGRIYFLQRPVTSNYRYSERIGGRLMDLFIKELKDVDVIESPDGNHMILQLTEKDGNVYGSKTDIKIPAESYAMFEEAIVEKWLDKQKLD